MEAFDVETDPPAAPLVPASVVAAAVAQPVEVPGPALPAACSVPRPGWLHSRRETCKRSVSMRQSRERRGSLVCAPQVMAVSCGSSHSLAILSE